MESTYHNSDLPRLSYWEYLFRIKANRNLLFLSLAASIGLLIIFKIFYPYPDFFSDSYSYINAAAERLDINTWPIGYSKFLEWIHTLTASGTALVAFQYFSVQLAAIHLLFSVLYFFNLTLWHRNALVIFVVVNPLTLYLCNTINSDALFAFVTILWVTELIWTIHWPRWYQVATSALLLFLAFTIRNNAYYYPVAGAIVFLLCQQKKWFKAAGISLPILLLVPFIIFTRNAAYKLTGTKQFSLFTGWQLANNALYIYDQIEVDSTDLPTSGARELNLYALQYFRRIRPAVYRPVLEDYVGNFFIRQPDAPLKQYYSDHYTVKGKDANIINWARTSEVFEPFGKTIIMQHPIAYIQYFVLPNVKHYFIPPLSHIGLYNYGQNEIDPIAKKWFGYKSNKIRVSSHDFQGQLLLIYIGIFLLLNVYYAWNILRSVFRATWRDWRTPNTATQICILGFLVLNFLFSIAATVNILRYQFVPMLILAAFGLALNHALEEESEESTSKVRRRKGYYSLYNSQL
jgi:hypothetical protein